MTAAYVNARSSRNRFSFAAGRSTGDIVMCRLTSMKSYDEANDRTSCIHVLIAALLASETGEAPFESGER